MIMSFCEKFQRAVGDTTIYRLSKITGIERTKLQRIKSGQKLAHHGGTLNLSVLRSVFLPKKNLI